MRTLKYSTAINEAFILLMKKNKDVFHIGSGINTPWYIGDTMRGLIDMFGEDRLLDTPVSENSIMGIAAGAALTGMRPIVMYPRMDFMLYAMDQICNHTALLNFIYGGRITVPVTIRAIINRGGEQAAQHSQALHAIFAHVPGIKVVMPSNAYDAKGMLIKAVEDDNPVLYIEDRWLYNEECAVPEEYYTVPIDKAEIIKEGNDITIIASSYYVLESRKAADSLEKESISVELIDLRSIKPLDKNTILNSVKKTGRAVVVDGGWTTCGIASEICAVIAGDAFEYLKAPLKRVALPDMPAPASRPLERNYYPTYENIIATVKRTVEINMLRKHKRPILSHDHAPL